MAIANLQAQIANLTSQLSQQIERTTMQSVPTFGASYMQGYPVNQQDWSDHSNSMWWEPQQVQHEAYWQPYEEFYYNPMQPPPQQIQPNSGPSIDYDQILDVLTSMEQGLQNRAKELGELKSQMGEIAEFMGQIQEQSELSNSSIENSAKDFEIAQTITLEKGMEVGDEPKTSKPSSYMDEKLLFEEEEDDKATTSLEEALPQPILGPPPLPQPPKSPTPSNSSKVVPNSILSYPIPPNVPIPCRFMQSKEEEGEEGIFKTVPNIHEKEVAGECLEFVKEDVLETIISEEVRFYDTGQVTSITINLAKCNSPSISPWCRKNVLPKTFEVVFVLEFLLDHTGKPPPRISISFYTNMLLMIQAPTLEFKPLPDHFNYHLPFKDKGGIVWLEDVKASASW